MFKERLDAGLDDWIDDMQFGFHGGRSTGQASYLARRLQDIKEHCGKLVAMVLLDWEKASDKISQAKFVKVVKRFMIPDITGQTV